MSLVNDALRRAKQQTSQPAPVSSLRLRPLEPAPVEHTISPRTFPLVFITVSVVLIALVITRWLNIGGPVQPPKPVLISNPAPAVKVVAPALPEKISTPAKVEASPNHELNPETKLESAPPASAPAAKIETAAPQPAPIRLQAIFFNTDRPSAMVNGKTVFAGSHVGEFQVAAISPETVTLTDGGKTVLLRFNE
jgi:hypothetical protein